MIRIQCNFEASIGRTELDDYTRSLNLSVIGFTEDGLDIVLGRMCADQLLLRAAADDGEDLIGICDNDSGSMVDLFTSLFDDDYLFQAEFGVDENTDHVLFLWKSTFHPKLRPYQAGILNTLPEMLGNDSAMVMRRNACDLDETELVDLGFKRIAGTEFLFRHLAYMNEFTRVNPKGTEVPADFEVVEADAEWVLEHWNEEDM
jgi:hypothetical protein